jgi:hypothetical protein
MNGQVGVGVWDNESIHTGVYLYATKGGQGNKSIRA